MTPTPEKHSSGQNSISRSERVALALGFTTGGFAGGLGFGLITGVGAAIDNVVNHLRGGTTEVLPNSAQYFIDAGIFALGMAAAGLAFSLYLGRNQTDTP